MTQAEQMNNDCQIAMDTALAEYWGYVTVADAREALAAVGKKWGHILHPMADAWFDVAPVGGV